MAVSKVWKHFRPDTFLSVKMVKLISSPLQCNIQVAFSILCLSLSNHARDTFRMKV